MKVSLSRASINEEKTQRLWVRSHVQTRGYCSGCSIKKGRSWFLLRDKGAAERWGVSNVPPNPDSGEAVSILLQQNFLSCAAPSAWWLQGWGEKELFGLSGLPCPQLGYEPRTDTFRGWCNITPQCPGELVLPQHLPLCPAEQSPAGRGGLSTVSRVFQEPGKASRGGQFPVWCFFLADSFSGTSVKFRKFYLHVFLLEKVTLVDDWRQNLAVLILVNPNFINKAFKLSMSYTIKWKVSSQNYVLCLDLPLF